MRPERGTPPAPRRPIGEGADAITISTAAPIQFPAPTGRKASDLTSTAAELVVEDAAASPGANASARTLGIRPRMMLRPDARVPCWQRRTILPASQSRQRHHVWVRSVQVSVHLLRPPREAGSLWRQMQKHHIARSCPYDTAVRGAVWRQCVASRCACPIVGMPWAAQYAAGIPSSLPSQGSSPQTSTSVWVREVVSAVLGEPEG